MSKDTIILNRADAIAWLQTAREAVCIEHGSNDDEHDVLIDMMDTILAEVGDIPSEHEDC
jgi:hypothetical protein